MLREHMAFSIFAQIYSVPFLYAFTHFVKLSNIISDRCKFDYAFQNYFFSGGRAVFCHLTLKVHFVRCTIPFYVYQNTILTNSDLKLASCKNLFLNRFFYDSSCFKSIHLAAKPSKFSQFY